MAVPGSSTETQAACPSTSQDEYTNIDFDMNIHLPKFTDVYVLFNYVQGTILDRIIIKNANITTKCYYSTCALIGRLTSRLSNIEDNTKWVSENATYFVYSLKGDIINADIKSNFYYTRYYQESAAHFVNVLFEAKTFIDRQKETGYAYQDKTVKDNVFCKNGIDDETFTISTMNDYFTSHGEDFPDGSYLPWIQDSKGRFHLDFDAKDDALYVISNPEEPEQP